MTKLKVINQEDLNDWAKEIFQKNSFNMVDVSSKKETFRRALASGKIYVDKEVFDLIKNKIIRGEDLFSRNIKYKKMKIDETFPKYIIENKEKFNKWTA